jgi:Tol biopolymer transport system component
VLAFVDEPLTPALEQSLALLEIVSKLPVHQTGASPDGRYVAFGSTSSNLVSGDTNATGCSAPPSAYSCGVDIFVKDRQTGAIARVNVAADGTQANGTSLGSPALSADGRYAAFWSNASNLVSGSAFGMIVKDRQTGAVERVDVAAYGTLGNQGAETPALSSDGRYVAFFSFATNLVPGDTNGTYDVFVKDRQTGAIERVDVAADGSQGDSAGQNPTLSADGRYVAFHSAATNLVPCQP